MLRCDFCGTKDLSIAKYKCVGMDFGKRVETTIKMCVCCNANTDNEWLTEQIV